MPIAGDLAPSPVTRPARRSSDVQGDMNGVKVQARAVDAPAAANGRHLRIAAVADLHCARTSRGKLAGLFARMAEHADVLLLGGDLTDYGLPEEAKILSHELKDVRRSQIIAVLGNHDFHSDKPQEVKEILIGAGIKVLDGDVEIGR